jgi:hypothetical protein
MTQPSTATLELDDIQGIILRDRPFPYFGAYLLLRIDNPAQGCLLLRRLVPQGGLGDQLARSHRHGLVQCGFHL